MDVRPGGSGPTPIWALPDSAGRTVDAAGPAAGLDDIDSMLERLPERAPADQLEILADIHLRLTAALAATSGQPGSPAAPPGPQPRGR